MTWPGPLYVGGIACEEKARVNLEWKRDGDTVAASPHYRKLLCSRDPPFHTATLGFHLRPVSGPSGSLVCSPDLFYSDRFSGKRMFGT